MKKKSLKEPAYIPLLYDDAPFEIYQLTEQFKFNAKRKHFTPADMASPAYGSRVDDQPVFVDNAGKVDVDMNYDYIRKDEDKHISDAELIAKYGTIYYERNILDREKVKGYLGGQEPQLKDEKPIVKEKPRKKLSLFEEDADTFLHDEEPKPVETPVVEEEREFTLNVNIDDEPMEYGQANAKMPKSGQTSIPSFLTSKPEEPKEAEPAKFSFDKVSEEDFAFDDMPTMESPDIEFVDNPPVDRNISIEEAIARANSGNYATTPQPKPNYEVLEETLEETTEEAVLEETIVREPVKEEKKPVFQRENKYENYHIDYEPMFSKSTKEEEALPEWLETKKDIINQTLISFGINGEVCDYTKGPAFTRYEIMLAQGVNVKKVNQIRDNLAMNLQVTSLRILCPIPGKNTVGIEAPNDVAEVVKFGDIINPEFVNGKKPLMVALGKDIEGDPVYQDITSMPHALIAGATKSGKSVSINTILVSLLLKNSPDRLKLILVDPKMVEMTFYQDIPHLAVPVITDLTLAGEALKWACEEMDRRYLVFAKNRVRNIEEYEKKRAQFPEMENMPYILTVIDEFNDLVMQVGQEVNDSIVRLAQKARACGMHIILATQRPTVQVVNGTIKSNVPCRIAFRVASQIDSQTILDEVGAENLLGRGDMLIKNEGAPMRAQGAYISDDEICAVCDYLVHTYKPDYLFNLDDLKKRMQAPAGTGSLGGRDVAAESDELLFQIAQFCVDSNACSINSIQQQFQLGFNRASRIVTMLEDRNIVSTKNGKQSREILVDTYKLREMFGVDED